MKYFLIFSISFLLSACSWLTPETEGIVAKMNGKVITTQEIYSLLPEAYSPEDSVYLVENYIKNWVTKQKLIEESNKLLSEDKRMEIESKVLQYQEDLLVSSVEEALLSQQKIESPTEEEIKTYYTKNTKSFPLQETMIRYRYVNVPTDSVRKYKRLLLSSKKKNKELLEQKAEKYNYTMEDDENHWMSFKKLQQLSPIPPDDPMRKYLRKDKVFVFDNNGMSFVLQIVDFARKGEQAPYKFIKNNIKNILINKRKLHLLSQKKNKLYEQAIQNDEIEKK